MEIQVHKRLTAVLALAALLSVLPANAARPRKEKADSLVRLMKAESIEQLTMNGQQYRKAIKSTFLHNGTYLISDTALWNVDSKIINAKGNVKVIQDETILTSDKLDYLIEEDLAQFRGTLVQLQNKKNNLLRTRHLDYNTKDSVALFKNGAAMRDAKGQIIESDYGTYSSATKVFEFEDHVNMFSDSVFVKTSKLQYLSESDKAVFPTFIDFWKGGNMLSADKGWYDKRNETVFFEKRVHGLSEDQEAWSDSLFYYRGTGDLLLLGNVQVQDTTRNVTAVGERLHFVDSLDRVMLSRNAAVALISESQNRKDTIYMGADTLIYRTIRMCDIPGGTVKACQSRLSDIMTDPVTEFRRKAAEEAAKAAEEAKEQLMPAGAPASREPKGGAPKGNGKEAPKPAKEKAPEPEEPEEPEAPEEEPVAAPDEVQARKDSLIAPLDAALAKIDSLVGTKTPADSLAAEAGIDGDDVIGEDMDAPVDSLALQDTLAIRDSMALRDTIALSDTLALRDSIAPVDSLAPADTTAAADTVQRDTIPPDTTKVGFMYGIHNVKIFRNDIQMRCDSMQYCDLDSIARFYMDPVVWNDGNRQYSADSLFILVGGGGPRKASLQSNAFVITQEDESSFDQIKGAEIMAWFDSTDNSLKRFDALGGASALFYIRENEVFATVNKVESKMLSGLLSDGSVDQVYYFESPKNNAYPTVQLPDSEKKMKGFNWRPDEKPSGPEDITDLKMRASERAYYLSKPRTRFQHTEVYFPGYMPQILREIAVRDSLAKIPRPKNVPDTSAFAPDSLGALRDSLAVLDSIAVRIDTTVLRDSVVTVPAAPDSTVVETPAAADSTAVSKPEKEEEVDPLAIPTVDPKQKRKEERELRRKLRIAARDARIAAREARWAELDRQDSLKLAAKKQKELDKQRAKTLRILKAMEKQRAKDDAKLQKYIQRYQKQLEREQKRAAAKAAREAERRRRKGELEIKPEPEPETKPVGEILMVPDDPDAPPQVEERVN